MVVKRRGKGLNRRTSGNNLKPKKNIAKKVPYRNLYEDGITYSFLSQFHNCRESARLQYVEGWYTEGLAMPLDFGLAFHDCLEWVASGNSPDRISQPLSSYQKSKLSNTKLRTDERKQLDMLVGMVKVVFPLYAEYWKAKDADFKYVLQEEAFKVQHKINYYGEEKTIPIRGRIDAAFTRKSDGIFCLQENKTKGKIDEDGIQSALHMDMQTMMYCLALRYMHGTAPAEVLYNVIRRPGLKQRKKETVDQFLSRVREDIHGRPQWYFMRWRVDFSPGDLDRWVENCFNPIVIQVIRWWDSIAGNPFAPSKSPEHFTDPEGLFGRYGRSNYFDALTKGNYQGLRRARKI